ncbi:LOW QUALITY PROTEIN: hypothetical protein PanWU01x14_281110 [Parasponia andersonii]|uniref:Uncharacterized protein n=1 Tax=Parasponia andersonii TaxID=3476 RepID=A0A2P5B1C7_PARAD|nr:LOW QUALITY PROTEIN: hypothetical protein PanWU01x14_281110 [Parasponia andersonii]
MSAFILFIIFNKSLHVRLDSLVLTFFCSLFVMNVVEFQILRLGVLTFFFLKGKIENSDLSHTPHLIYPILEAELGPPGGVIVRRGPHGLVSYEKLEHPTKTGTHTLEGLSCSEK